MRYYDSGIPVAAMILVTFIVALFFAASLDANDTNSYPNRNIRYTKDNRTNLCFAYQEYNRESFVNVPCSPEVEKHLTKGNN